MLFKWCRTILLTGLTFASGAYGLTAGAQALVSGSPFLGLDSLQQEVELNPCLPESQVQDTYGTAAREYLLKERSRWPAGMCQDPALARGIADWLYNSSALLAKTDRPLVMADIIQRRSSILRACPSKACLHDKLPAMTDWAKTNLDRTPVYGSDDQPISVKGALLTLPKLSLRGLDLPLPGQEKNCEGGTIDDLEFFSTNLKVSGKAYVLVKCRGSEAGKKTWVLENDGGKVWRPVVDLRASTMQIGEIHRNRMPLIFSYLELPRGTRVRILAYEDNRYQELLRFLLVEDNNKLAHAFEVDR